MIKKQIIIEFQLIEADELDYSTTPEAVLRAKSEMLAEFLGCEVHDAERLLLDRITDIGV
jgi:hypothetical protein